MIIITIIIAIEMDKKVKLSLNMVDSTEAPVVHQSVMR